MSNLAIDFKKYLNRVDTDYLSSLQTQIEILREKLYSYAKSITTPLDCILVNHYEERLESAQGRPMLGEYAAFIIGDLFSAKPRSIDLLAFPWLMLYEQSLLLDDLLDKTRPYWSHELLLSQILLESSINEYKKILGNDNQLWSAYDLYRRECIFGILHEMERSQSKENQSNTRTIIQQGRKAAMVKFCATSILYLDKNRLLTSEEEKGIDHLCAGIQLLDDITDALEDHNEGRLNVLLEDVYEWIKINIFNSVLSIYPKDINANQLMIGLIYSGSISRSWKATAEEIDKALGLFNNIESQATRYFNSISIECKERSMLIDKAVEDISKSDTDFSRALAEGDHNKIIEANLVKLSENWEKINDYINNGPKASN